MTQRTSKLLALALATSLAAACTRTPSPSMPNGVATLASASGDVVVQHAGTGAWAPAAPGTRLVKGDRVWAREGRADIQYDVAETASLGARTVVEIR